MIFKPGDRVRIRKYADKFSPLEGAVGTVTYDTCDTARYVRLDVSGLEFNFVIRDLELINEPAQDSYMELFL
jgi:hypothetical protein